MSDEIGQPFQPRHIERVSVDGCTTMQEALDKLREGTVPGDARDAVLPARPADDTEIVRFDDADFLLHVKLADDKGNAQITMISNLAPVENLRILSRTAQRIIECEQQQASKN